MTNEHLREAAAGRRSRANRERWLTSLVACMAAALVLAAPAPGQGDARLEVSMIALEHVRGSLPDGRTVLDPRSLCRAGLVGWTCPAGMAERVSAMDMELGSREFSHVCVDSSGACNLVGADVLVELEDPRIFGRTARVGLRIWWRADGAARVMGRRTELHLQRSSGVWQVVREERGVPPRGGGSVAEGEEHAGPLGPDDRNQR